MKMILVHIIELYQFTLSPDKGILVRIGVKKPSVCMFYPTCSDYAMREISDKGVFIGLYNASKRVLSCHPYGKNKE